MHGKSQWQSWVYELRGLVRCGCHRNSLRLVEKTNRITAVTFAVLSVPFFIASVVAFAGEPPYPSRPVRLIAASAAGGGLDALARIMAPALTDATGQPWIVDNRGGAAGNVGTELVVRANPDGYTVLLASSTALTVNPGLYPQPFSVEKDLQPVTMLGSAAQILVIHPGLQANTLKEFIALARQRPGTINFASAGVGTSAHLGAELFIRRAGIALTHIPYKGGGPAAAATLAGEAQFLAGSIAATIGFIRSGQLRALATTGPERSKVTPEIPTVAESGFPGFESGVWNSVLLPRGTPKSIIEQIRREVIKTVQQPKVKDAMARDGSTPMTSTPEELAVRIREETRVWAEITRNLGLRGG